MNQDTEQHLRTALTEGCRQELDQCIAALTDACAALAEGHARIALGCFTGTPERIHYLAILLPRLAQLPEPPTVPDAKPEAAR